MQSSGSPKKTIEPRTESVDRRQLIKRVEKVQFQGLEPSLESLERQQAGEGRKVEINEIPDL